MKNHPVYEVARANRDGDGVAWIRTKDLSALIRSALAKSFPGVKFSVRSHCYSGGSSINVRWTDGPTCKSVEAVADPFAMGGFDGMIDLKFPVGLWLAPDGSVSLAENRGTIGSMGMVADARGDAHDPRAILIRGGADFVFCNRDLSGQDAMREQVQRLICQRQGVTYEGPGTRGIFGSFDRDCVSDHAARVLRETDFSRGQTIVGIENRPDRNALALSPFVLVMS